MLISTCLIIGVVLFVPIFFGSRFRDDKPFSDALTVKSWHIAPLCQNILAFLVLKPQHSHRTMPTSWLLFAPTPIPSNQPTTPPTHPQLLLITLTLTAISSSTKLAHFLFQFQWTIYPIICTRFSCELSCYGYVIKFCGFVWNTTTSLPGWNQWLNWIWNIPPNL